MRLFLSVYRHPVLLQHTLHCPSMLSKIPSLESVVDHLSGGTHLIDFMKWQKFIQTELLVIISIIMSEIETGISKLFWVIFQIIINLINLLIIMIDSDRSTKPHFRDQIRAGLQISVVGWKYGIWRICWTLLVVLLVFYTKRTASNPPLKNIIMTCHYNVIQFFNVGRIHQSVVETMRLLCH